MKRVFFDLILFLSVLFLPWWMGVFLALAGMFLFDNFYEYLAYGAVVFSLYFTGGETIISRPFYFALILVFSFVLIQVIKDNIIFYKK